jgi:Xaa-Pro aminopeptidase
MNLYPSKFASLREAMKENKIDAYIIPSTDPHLGEYISDHWRIIQWLTGFTGSSATVVITESFAGLWTDSRYLIQAEEQLKGSGVTLMKPLLSEINDFNIWLKANIKPGNKIACDGRTFSVTRLRKLENILSGRNILIDTESDIISVMWSDRPPMPDSMAFDHDTVFCGLERSVKIKQVREQMVLLGVNYHLLTSPDEI